MGFIDKTTGKELTPEEVQARMAAASGAAAPSTSIVPNDPAVPALKAAEAADPRMGGYGTLKRQAAQAPSDFVSALKRNIIPGTIGTGAQIGAEALAGLLAPESLLIPAAGAFAAGLANVGTSKLLPERLGGSPDQSKTSAFLQAAIPAAGAAGITRGVGSQLGKKLATAVGENKAEFLTKTGKQAAERYGMLKNALTPPEPTVADVRDAARVMGSPTGVAAPELKGEAASVAADAAKEAVTGPINRLRTAVGEPIGAAYKSLKNVQEPISEDEAQNLGNALMGIRDSLISPAPKFAGVIRQLQKYGVAKEGGSQLEATESIFGGENTIGRGAARAIKPNQTLANMTPEQIGRVNELVTTTKLSPQEAFEQVAKESGQQQARFPSLDELRGIRQHLATQLKNAKGGDRYALTRGIGEIDGVLADHLPSNMGQLRNSYRQFIQRHPWEGINQLQKLKTPGQVADWLFTREPAIKGEIIDNATPEERDTMQELFMHRALMKIHPQMPGKMAHDELVKSVTPHVQDGTFRDLFGGKAQQTYEDMIHLPERMAAQRRNLSSPQGEQAFMQAAAKQADQLGEGGFQAFKAGYKAWFDQLPRELQAGLPKPLNLTGIGPPLASEEVPRLPSQAQSLAEVLRPKKIREHLPQFMTRYAAGAGIMSLAGAASGGSGAWMERAALGFAAWNGTVMGYRAFMAAGGAKLVAHTFVNPTARGIASGSVKALVNIGTRTTGDWLNASDAPEDQNDDAANQ